MKDHTDLKIALAILIPSFIAGGLIGQFGLVYGTSNANCDEAGISENNGGNQRGNAQCFFRDNPNYDNSDPEPIRSGNSPQCQGEKPSDLDGDSNTFCNIRGN